MRTPHVEWHADMTQAEQAIWQWQTATIHDPDMLYFRRYAGRIGLFIDVGANRGQTAITVRQVWPECEIVSFEPNTMLEPALRQIADVLGGVTLHFAALGEERGVIRLLLPVVDGVPLLEQATILAEHLEKPYVVSGLHEHGLEIQLREITVPLHRLDEYALSPIVVKIDAEGAELGVVRGAEQMLRRCKPVLMVENGDWGNVTTYLSSLGYTPHWYDVQRDELRPFAGEQVTNSFYIAE
jgi:FkbM family methyltransferase